MLNTIDLSAYIFTTPKVEKSKTVNELSDAQRLLLDAAKNEAEVTYLSIVQSYEVALSECKNLIDALLTQQLANWSELLKELFLEIVTVKPVSLKDGKFEITLKPILNHPAGGFKFFKYGKKDGYQRSENFQFASKAKAKIEKCFTGLSSFKMEATVKGNEFYIDSRAERFQSVLTAIEKQQEELNKKAEAKSKETGKKVSPEVLPLPVFEDFLNITVLLSKEDNPQVK